MLPAISEVAPKSNATTVGVVQARTDDARGIGRTHNEADIVAYCDATVAAVLPPKFAAAIYKEAKCRFRHHT